MNTFPPPPEMRPGGYPSPQRRTQPSTQPNAPSHNGARHAAPKRRASHANAGSLSITKQQWIFLGCLFVLFCICLVCYLSYEGKHSFLIAQRTRAEQEYHREVSRHRVKYREWIEYYAAVNNIDPAFVAAIIKRESDYDPFAVSSVKARGLMQIMPDTGEWLAGKVDVYDFSTDMLFDPETNIKMGCWYLGYLSRKFDGDPITVACAYHAGQGNVEDHWLKKFSANGKTLTLEEIPMDDTKYYARKVLEAYAIYQQHHY